MVYNRMPQDLERLKLLLEHLHEKKDITVVEWMEKTGYGEGTVSKLFSLAAQLNTFIKRRKGHLTLTE